MNSVYMPVLIQIIVALVFCSSIIVASHIFGQRSFKNKINNSAYECGIAPEGNPHPKFAVKFYVTAMLFIIFDVEAVYLFPLTTVFKEFVRENISIFFPILIFTSVMGLGLIYEIKKGSLNWINKKNKI